MVFGILSGNLELILSDNVELILSGNLELILSGNLELILSSEFELILSKNAELILSGDYRAGGAGPTTPTLVGPKILSFMVKALYFQSYGRTNNCQIEVHFQMVGPILHSFRRPWTMWN